MFFRLLFCICIPVLCFGQGNNVGIGTTTPDNSAVLDISSVNKGVLVPRLNTQQRQNIPIPADGLLVYDIDLDCFFFYQSSSSSWQSLCNTTGLQGATGPTGATGATGPSGGPQGPTGPTGSPGFDVFSLTGDSTLVVDSFPLFTAINGMDTTVTLTDTATVFIFSTGNIRLTSNQTGDIKNSIVQLFINNQPEPYTFEAIPTWYSNIYRHWIWSISKSLLLYPGTYHFQLKISFDILSDPPFYPVAIIACPYYEINTPPNALNRHCNMTFQVFYR